MVNIRAASSNILRHGLVCEATSLHLHQLARGVLETSERAMSSDIKNDFEDGNTLC